MLALLLSATAGCAGIVVEVDPAPLSSMAPTCVVTGLKADRPVVHEPRTTSTQEVVVEDHRVASSVPIPGSPEEPRITWTELKVATVDDVVRWIPPEVKRTFSTGRSPGRDEVAAAVAELGPEDGAFVGYAAIRPVQVRFAGTCADGDAVGGWLISWTDPEVGVVKCGAVPGAALSAGGRLAREERCGKF